MKAFFNLTFFISIMLSNHAAAQDRISSFVKQSKTELTKSFLDPEAAKYRNLEVREWVGDKNIKYLELCGEVNAKNSMGAYTGYKKFNANPESARIVGLLKSGESISGESVDGALAIELLLTFRSTVCGADTKLIRKIKD